jgi:O-acetyl-ADP-ribose deacetylase (regulator of RNase III)
VDAIVNAKLTEDCSLSTQYVIHIAAPVLNGSARGEAVLLTFCLRRSLSFPSISTDVYTYLVAQVAKIMEIAHETPKIVWGLRKVVFCCFSDRDRVVNESLPREERVVYNY